MNDFIFGTLASEAQRQEHTRRLRSGITHRSARTPLDPLPGQPLQLELTVGPAFPGARAWAYWAVGGEDPAGAGGLAATGQATPMECVGVEWDTLVWGYVCRFRAALPPQPAGTVLRYRLSAQALDGTETFADGGAYYAVYIDHDPLPEWAREAVIYQVFVDRFFPGAGKTWQRPASLSGFYGGTLAGVTEKLDWIASLGADVLWLSPIFASPSHHGYDATDLFEVEPRLGTKADLRALLAAAHALGMRVLLDFVPNHVSDRHASFQAALGDRRSPYFDWYTFTEWPQEYESFFGVRDLPQLNLRQPGARQHMLDAAAYWLDFGVDGYRVDYALGPTPDFWADFRRVTRQHKADCWTFGEVVEPPDAQLSFAGLLDGCLDFNLLEALRQTLAFGQWDAVKLSAFIDRHEAYFPPDFSRPSFLDNHDMNRFLWAVAGDLRRLRLAALCQFSLAGPPVIYYGTEVGLSQERDVRHPDGRGVAEESRQPMLWGGGQDESLLAFYRQLVRLRRLHPALRRGARQSVNLGPQIVAYRREGEDDRLLVVLNLAEVPQELLLEEKWSQIALGTGPECSILGGRLSLPPLGGVILI